MRSAERAAAYDETAAFPQADIDDLRSAGLLGLLVPVRLGGLGAGFEDYTRVAMALAVGSGATALLFNMHASVTGALATVSEDLIRALGAGEDFLAARDAILAGAADGALYAVAISESGVGSRMSRLSTTYRPEGGGFRITGSKVTCSGAGSADAYLVAARRADGVGAEPVDGAASLFLVPAGEGVVCEGSWDPLGMRATASLGLQLDCRVGSHALLGTEGLALTMAYLLPHWLVASYAAVYVGVAEAAVEHARSALVRRYGADGVPASARSRLGRCDALAGAGRATVEHAARLVDRAPTEPDTHRWVYTAKLVAGDTAMEVAASVAEACGLGDLRRGSPLERIFRDARLGALMPPRSDVCAELLGAQLVGLDPRSDLEEPPW